MKTDKLGVQAIKDLYQRFRLRYCRGIYSTFREAHNAIPSARRAGYNNKESSEIYMGYLDRVRPSDYAGFHWLGQLLPNAKMLFDFGGNVGWSFFAYQKYMRYPPNLRWLVCDVPAVVETGRKLAEKRRAIQLGFTVDFHHANGADILMTNGTLQYVDRELPELLAELSHKPRHLLINRVPFTETPTYYTVQDIGTACCAYRISNQAAFVSGLEALGYAQVDSWSCYESSMRILFHPRRSLRHYSGMYFRLEGLRVDSGPSSTASHCRPVERWNFQGMENGSMTPQNESKT